MKKITYKDFMEYLLQSKILCGMSVINVLYAFCIGAF